MVFALIWSENGYRLCPLDLELGMVFKATMGVYEYISIKSINQ